ncbi:MAG: type II toxin-antitoxin system Phd/YefM family antitoxin [Synergistaceae bacterium]|nr:type II toxin-antitoxin system Phd/YefM family antitoxin [Synergistota bacterium]NLM70949.1 type II toxin-antitoxin system Phd/YefM family antitoxin [Synergistaceae bacterium]
MSRITATEARKRLFQLLDEVAESHVPVRIAGRRNTAVLVGESDWRAIEETLFLCGIPGMRESIVDGMATPIEDCSEDVEW